MATQQTPYQTFEAWQAATEALQKALFPPVGHEAPTLEAKQALVADLEWKLAAFKAAYGL